MKIEFVEHIIEKYLQATRPRKWCVIVHMAEATLPQRRYVGLRLALMRNRSADQSQVSTADYVIIRFRGENEAREKFKLFPQTMAPFTQLFGTMKQRFPDTPEADWTRGCILQTNT